MDAPGLHSRGILRALVVFWLVVVPVSIALLGQGSEVVGWAMTLWAVVTGIQGFRELRGWKKPSEWHLEREAEAQRKDHHDYYCQRNPEGFARLKVEVLERELREGIAAEADALKRRVPR